MGLQDINTFDLNKIFQIQIPVTVNGRTEMKYVEKIYKERVDPNNILWQVHRCNVNFNDNFLVNVGYNINVPNIPNPEPNVKNDIMYLVPIGGIDKNGTIVSGFTTNNYARTPICINWLKDNSFELNLKIKTGSSVNTRQELFSMTNTDHIELEILSNKLHWEYTDTYSKTTLKTNQCYFVKFIKNGTKVQIYLSEDGTNFKLEIDSTANFINKNEYMHFGIDKVVGGTTLEPFLGTIDLSQCTFLYDNVLYKIDMIIDSYWDLIKGGNIKVSSNVISGFEVKNASLTPQCSYAYSKNYIDWTNLNDFEVCLKIHTGNDTSKSQELITWRDYNPNVVNQKSTNWLNNDFCIENGLIKWEYTQLKTSGSVKITQNSDYYVIFSRNRKTGSISVLNSDKTKIQALNITQFPADCKQYMYLGIDEMSILQNYSYFSDHCVFTGKIDCNESYVVLNSKKYKFRI